MQILQDDSIDKITKIILLNGNALILLPLDISYLCLNK